MVYAFENAGPKSQEKQVTTLYSYMKSIETLIKTEQRHPPVWQHSRLLSLGKAIDQLLSEYAEDIGVSEDAVARGIITGFLIIERGIVKL
jgi:hypothetical protein